MPSPGPPIPHRGKFKDVNVYCKRRIFRAFRAWPYVREHIMGEKNLNYYASNRIRFLYARKFVCAKMPDRARCAKM